MWQTQDTPSEIRQSRRTRWLITIAIALLAFAASGSGCAPVGQQSQADEVNTATLPPAVRDALSRAGRMYSEPLRGAKWTKVSQLAGTDHPVYQLRGTNSRGNTIEMEVTTGGRIIEVEEHGLPLAEVPEPVVETLKTRMPDGKPARVEAIYQGGHPRPVCYGFEGTDAAGKEIEVYISADGKTFWN